jgi:DNA-binding transcriptional LysR family regulator
MNLRQVRYFIAICEEGSFTRAAKKCGVRQPSLTGAMQRLERELGGQLFVRSTPIQLTSLGAALRPCLVQIDEAVDRVHQCAAAQVSRSHSNEPVIAGRAMKSASLGLSQPLDADY